MRFGKIGRCVALALAGVLFGLAGLGSVQEKALSQDVASDAAEGTTGPDFATDHVLVKAEGQASGDAIDRIEAINGAEEEDQLPIAGVRVAELPAGLSVGEAVERYESDPAVAYAEPDFKVSLEQDATGTASTPRTPEDPDYAKQWNLNNSGQDGGTPDADIDAPEAWGVTTGDPGVVVAIVDGGVDIGHPDLNENIWTNSDEIPNNGQDDDANGHVDDVHGWNFVGDPAAENNDVGENSAGSRSYGHGTHVAGIMAAEGNNGFGTTGIGWGTKVMPLKFVGADGSGLVSDAMEALDYAVEEGAKVSNHSWGCYYTAESTGCYSQALHDAIKVADAAGHLLVTSAGNEAQNTDTQAHYPSGYAAPNVISVAATTNKDALWTYSNYGTTTVDLAAPGQNVYSTAPGYFDYKTGTSMAAPHVAGVAALVKSASPGLGHLEVKNRILNGVDKVPSLAGKVATGGRLNAASALGVVPTIPAKPTALTASASPTTLNFGARATVSGKLTSNSGALAGRQVVLEQRPVGTTEYVPFATVTTGADGTFSGMATPDKNADFRARFAGEPETGLVASTSPNTRVNVHVNVTLSMYEGNLDLNGSLAQTHRYISGYVRPNHAGRYVAVKIYKRGVGLRVDRAVKLDANSFYETSFEPKSTGTYDVKVIYSADEDNLGDVSPTRTFEVVAGTGIQPR